MTKQRGRKGRWRGTTRSLFHTHLLCSAKSQASFLFYSRYGCNFTKEPSEALQSNWAMANGGGKTYHAILGGKHTIESALQKVSESGTGLVTAQFFQWKCQGVDKRGRGEHIIGGGGGVQKHFWGRVLWHVFLVFPTPLCRSLTQVIPGN